MEFAARGSGQVIRAHRLLPMEIDMSLHALTLHEAAIVTRNALSGLTVILLFLCWITLRKILKIVQSK